MVGVGETHIINGPFNLVIQHTIHRGNNLHRHVDEAFAEHESDMVLGLEERLEGGVEGLVRDGFLEHVGCEGLY